MSWTDAQGNSPPLWFSMLILSIFLIPIFGGCLGILTSPGYQRAKERLIDTIIGARVEPTPMAHSRIPCEGHCGWYRHSETKERWQCEECNQIDGDIEGVRVVIDLKGVTYYP